MANTFVPCNPETKEFAPFFNCVKTGEGTKSFTNILIGIDGWYSVRCRLIWKLKQSRFHRYYIQLGVSVRKNDVTISNIYESPLRSKPTKGILPSELESCSKAPKFYRKLFPTPKATEIEEDYQGWRQRMLKNDNPKCKGKTIPNIGTMAINGMLPTPLARDHMGCRHPETLKLKGRKPSNSLGDTINFITGRATRLNSMFILEMMGFPSDWLLKPFLKTELPGCSQIGS